MALLFFAQTSATGALIALLVIVGGFILGSLAAALARRIATRSGSEHITTAASAIATLVFSLILIAALIAALGIINQEALEQLVDDFIEFIPRLLAATIVLIIGNIVGALAEAGVERSLGHVSAELRQRVPPIIKWTIQGFVLVIAANQLGIDTTIISVVVAAVFFGLALAGALLAGLGGRDVARQVAAGRALRRELKVGDSISLGGYTERSKQSALRPRRSPATATSSLYRTTRSCSRPWRSFTRLRPTTPTAINST